MSFKATLVSSKKSEIPKRHSTSIPGPAAQNVKQVTPRLLPQWRQRMKGDSSKRLLWEQKERRDSLSVGTMWCEERKVDGRSRHSTGTVLVLGFCIFLLLVLFYRQGSIYFWGFFVCGSVGFVDLYFLGVFFVCLKVSSVVLTLHQNFWDAMSKTTPRTF